MNLKPPPVLLLAILDGWGLSELRDGNAMAHASLPTYETLRSGHPWTSLEASGRRVGLPAGQMGNSEVGHLNIGAGRVVHQDITRIDQAVKSGELFHNSAIEALMKSASDHALHLIGLVSDGGVHSHIRHLIALLKMAREKGLQRVVIHALTDGRDTFRKGGAGYLEQVGAACREIGVGKIATVGGRYYGMDRDNRWDRTEKAYRAIIEGKAPKEFQDPLQGIHASYAEDITDEFIVPFVVVDSNGNPVGRLRPDDAVLFFNFRADRARQLTRALTFEEFDRFPRSQPPVSHFVSMTEYDRTFDVPIAFPPVRLDKILVKLFCQHNISNLRLAETEKYAHVTYFFNGGEEQLFPGESRVLIPSPQVATYDLKPEMSAPEITDRLLQELDQGNYRAIVLNFANADMVGHTGDFKAAIQAVQTVDRCLGRIYAKIKSLGGIMFVTADHGNAEQMIDPQTGQVHTAHTTNPVPFIVVDPNYSGKLRMGGALEDIAPSVLDYFEIEKPPEMTGRSLLLYD